MLGTPSQLGLMPQAIINTLTKIYADSLFHHTIQLSYLEVYNESIKDLLTDDDTSFHDLREDRHRGMIITGLAEIFITDSEGIMLSLLKGDQNRTRERTAANEVSSRSHAIMLLTIQSKHRTTGEVRTARITLVDLAGSERAALTQNREMRMIEEASINRSLLALGNCINALVEKVRSGLSIYVPYRDSKLTRLLKNSLEGNCKTIMVATINPGESYYEDTIQTLKYADRARTIRTTVKPNTIKYRGITVTEEVN